MSIIIKSNNVAANNFGSVKMLGTTAQSEFDKYKARVLTDGGVIVDEARTLAAMEFIHGRKLLGKMGTVVGAYYGIMRVGDTVLKLYGLDGVDMVAGMTGAGPLPTYDSALSYARIKTYSPTLTTGGFFASEDMVVPSFYGKIGFAYVGSPDPDAPRPLYAGYGGGVASGQVGSLAQVNIGTTYDSLVSNEAWTDASPAYQSVKATADAAGGFCTFADSSTGVHRVYKDGELSVAGATTTVSPLLVKREQVLGIGALQNNVINTGAGYFSEFWAACDLSSEDAIAISAYLGGLY